jgi:predicted AAA+ superfamily ATPase
MFPLVQSEYSVGSYALDELVDWGTLPLVHDNFEFRKETLTSYVDNYLRQELIEEGIVRKVEPFARFLATAGQVNGQILNVENIARESKVKRPTVEKYFEVLYDTLIAYKLPAYQPNIRMNESAHSKFYFFDAGVARAAAGYVYETLDQAYRGFLFETYLLNEIRAYNDYAGKNRDLFYYAVRGSGDIDLVIQLSKQTKTRPDKVIAIELKLGSSWRSEWAKSLLILNENPAKSVVERSIIVYSGSQREMRSSVELIPVNDFLQELRSGKIF